MLPRRLSTSFYDIAPLPLEIDLLIEDLFDELDFYERALSRQYLQQPSYFRPQRPQQRRQRQVRPQPQLKQQRQFRPRQTSQIRPKSKNVRQRSTSRNLPFQQKQQKFQGRQQVQQHKPLMQQQIKKKKPQQQFGLQQQPFFGGLGGGVKSKSMQEKQKYRICIDCRGCDCDPTKITKSIKCGVNGLNHLNICAPCKTNPSKIFKRSYTLPSKVQHNKMVKSITPQGHCVLEFPMWDEEPSFLDIDLMPLQKIKTPEGKKAFFVQVPILPIMDPAKVKVCIKDNCNLIVKFEHKKTIGDICSRVFYCCQVPLPKNIDFSSIVCKQKKHVLNITVPVKKSGGMVSTTTTSVGYRDIPVHRKLRHRKQLARVVGGGAGIFKAMPSTMQQKQKKKPSMLSTPGISGLQKQPIQQQQQKLKKPQQQKTSPISTSQQQTQQPQQKLKQKQPTSGFSDIFSKSTTTAMPDITKKKKQKKPKTSNILNVSHQGQQYPKPSEGVSKGSDLLESVFGFGGDKSKQQQQQPSSTGQQQQSTPTQLDKGVQRSQGQVSDKNLSASALTSSSTQQATDVPSSQPSNISGSSDVNKPDISSSSTTQGQSNVPGSVIQ